MPDKVTTELLAAEEEYHSAIRDANAALRLAEMDSAARRTAAYERYSAAVSSSLSCHPSPEARRPRQDARHDADDVAG